MNTVGADHSASVLARLLNHSRTKREDYQSLLIRYVGERFLFRLGRSSYRDAYLLKGAYLLSITLEDQTYRTTKDIDFLKIGNADAQFILESLRNICSISYPEDAVEFDLDSISIQDIREHNAYQGQRAKIRTHIGKARVVLQIALSLLTSRMKDFYDLYIISRSFTLGFEEVSQAVRQTFARRKTALPTETPVVFTEQVSQNSVKQTQWKAFVRKLRNEHSKLELSDVIDRISEFTNALWGPDPDHPHVWDPKSGWQ